MSFFSLSDFDFELPAGLIAQTPPEERGLSRLLAVSSTDAYCDTDCSALADHLSPGDLLILNDTKVLRARLFGHKASGGAIEILVERVCDARQVVAQIRASKSPKPGTLLYVGSERSVTVLGREGEFFVLALLDDGSDWWQLLEQYGQMPLPPYIRRQGTEDDDTRYQTVFARQPGAVAAPTAGLHFTDALLDVIRQRGVDIAYVTLHVGAGTFQPVRHEDLSRHVMHKEYYNIPSSCVEKIDATRLRGGRIVAVGTTVLRALENAALSRVDNLPSVGDGCAALFILPGFKFQVVDRLMTNFHLPKSTLLMLVSAFAGFETIRCAYQHAIEQQYRFFSYGDAMLLTRRDVLSVCG